MGRALVAGIRPPSKKHILDALVKAYADYPVEMGRLDFTGRERPVQRGRRALETYCFSALHFRRIRFGRLIALGKKAALGNG